jgi:aspartyl-tRNA(Asn)/glutamyl-tRNA(Gln) amidotransferase subunit C
MSRISRDQVLHLAQLARLALDEEETAALTEQLDRVLEYARSLEGLDTEGIEPTSHPLPIRTPWREDRCEAPIPAEQAVANAPERSDTAFVVPKILDVDEL